MNIKLKPMGKGKGFTFPALPERLTVKNSAKYQSFDIISSGTIKIPEGMEPSSYSWDGEFFGEAKKDEAIVKKNAWQEPEDCVEILTNWMKEGAVLNLIVTDSGINVDVTISSLSTTPYGGYGNISYSIEFTVYQEVKVYTTKEKKSSSYMKKTKPRNSNKEEKKEGKTYKYTVKSGDTLWGIAKQQYGSGSKWQKIYSTNKDIIESTAKKYGKKNSDNGHWIYPGEVFTLVK